MGDDEARTKAHTVTEFLEEAREQVYVRWHAHRDPTGQSLKTALVAKVKLKTPDASAGRLQTLKLSDGRRST